MLHVALELFLLYEQQDVLKCVFPNCSSDNKIFKTKYINRCRKIIKICIEQFACTSKDNLMSNVFKYSSAHYSGSVILTSKSCNLLFIMIFNKQNDERLKGAKLLCKKFLILLVLLVFFIVDHTYVHCKIKNNHANII